jgi:very-short-patch-repair endonuclease
MQKKSIDTSMFYNASPEIFKRAKELRKNMTEAEDLLWKKLRNNKLGVRFRAQHPIDRFIADFYCHSAKLVIELDGEIHSQQKEYDINREAELEKYDITVIRFRNKEVFDNLDKVIQEIETYL